MGTQGAGRKRLPNLEKLTAEDDALNQIAREAEARLAARRTARAEAREIRMKELEKQHKERYYGLDYKWGYIEQWMEDGERYSRHARRLASLSDDEERMSVGSRGSLKVEERPDRDFLDRGSRTALNLSAATLSSLGGASSRRGSCDTSVSVEMEASIREMKDSVAEAEEKYRRAMVSNAQLHNDKSTLMYQVETLREELSDMEELLWEARRHADERTKAYERERDSHVVLQFQFKEMKETMRRSEDLLMEVSKLREQTHAYSQEVSDLQEALQWKERKIAALERQREISDVIQIERDQLRVEVLSLRDVVKKYGEVISPEVATDGGPRLDGAKDEVGESVASLLANEVPASGESMLGTGGDMTSRHCQINKPPQALGFSSADRHSRASLVSREARAGRQTNRMRTLPARLGRSCVPANGAIARRAATQSGNSVPELTFTPKVKSSFGSLKNAQPSSKRRNGPSKWKKSISGVCRTSVGKVHKSGPSASDLILDQKNIRSGNSAERQKTDHITLKQADFHRSPGQAEPPCSASLTRDFEDCPATTEQKAVTNVSEKYETPHEETDHPNMTDFVFVESSFGQDALSPEDFLPKWPGSSPTAAGCKFRSFVEELKVMAAPEWLLLKLPEGKLFEERPSGHILETNVQAGHEPSVADVDSCEEVHEEMEQ
ncbi:uncharacterized protein lrrfip1b isoform X3 [Hippocampus zosterae]|uniref:uncharacterized protein lrrfip1b isoform X3 n=1 Tax=Hippocampus zosterae TaxID=109293 RepID=UPI00223E4463|nr:uncharacterized protein lrrfip1b isoform X3 [Hippocampus zosterae]